MDDTGKEVLCAVYVWLVWFLVPGSCNQLAHVVRKGLLGVDKKRLRAAIMLLQRSQDFVPTKVLSQPVTDFLTNLNAVKDGHVLAAKLPTVVKLRMVMPLLRTLVLRSAYNTFELYVPCLSSMEP